MAFRRDNVLGFFRALSRAFFRRIEVSGLENVPARGGGLVVAWHPNGVVDPVLLATQSPRPIVFGARHGLFAIPVLGGMMRALGTVPIYRAADAPSAGGASTRDSDAERRARNRQSLDALASAMAQGQLCALFPEGKSHDAPHLAELKFGAAKVFQRALQLTAAGDPAPVILPVGLHYDDKSVFR
ncbi:MAG TPA: 1-acyl-sn-glycerol-3-phosphate acyltransferase, partial [Polyangiales bacterium]|nr:1-acyl-sn-glycerol-3-phosphate acyltransferase [Polyangiales bacterium]